MKNELQIMIEDINNISPKFKERIALSQTMTAQIIGISDNTLSSWRKEGIGPEYLKSGGRILYPKTKIAQYLLNTIKTI